MDEGVGDHSAEDAAQDAAARAARAVAEAMRAAEQLQDATRRSVVLSRIATAVARALALGEMVSAVVDGAVDVLGATAACAYLADERKRELSVVGQRGVPDDVLAEVRRVSFDGPFLASRAASTRALFFLTRDELPPELSVGHAFMDRAGADAVIALPLLARDRLIGVLVLAFPDAEALAAAELSFLRTLADIFAVGLANALTFEHERRLRVVLETIGNAALAMSGELDLRRMLQTIVDRASAVADAEFAALGIFDGPPDRPFDPFVFAGMSEEQVRRIGRFPGPVGTFGVVAREKQTVRIADVRAHPAFKGFPPHHPVMTSFLGLPILSDGQSVGNLYLANKRSAPEFSEDDERAMKLFAAHASAALLQHRLRAQVESERARFLAIFENAPGALVFVEAGSGRLLANPRAVRLAGRALSKASTLEDWRDLLSEVDGTPLPPERTPVRRALAGEETLVEELLLTRPDGDQLPVSVSAASVRSLDGELLGAIVAYEDLSADKELQRMRQEWASVIAHDLRQPLSVIITYARMLQQAGDHPEPERLHRALEHVGRAAGSMNKMISDLSDVSRLESKELTLEPLALDVASLSREVLERQGPLAAGHALTLRPMGALPKVRVDPVRFEQVLGNLITNAVKYSDPDSEIVVTLRPDGDGVRVSVTNAGPGIPPEELGRLFQRHFRTARAREGGVRGLGLGLYISRGLVEAHGGRIWAESTPGQTTTFHFTLPRAS